MIQEDYYLANKDLVTHVDSIVNWQEIVDTYENGFEDSKLFQKTGNEKLALAPSSVEEAVDFYKTMLQSAGKIAWKKIAPHSRDMDRIGLSFKDGKIIFPRSMIEAYNSIKEAGLLPYGLSRHYGGIGLPASAQALLLEIIARADASISLAVGCANIGEIIEYFASPAIINEWLPKLAAGEFTSAMALTEPEYGSDLASLKMRANRSENGKWLLNGVKRFITQAAGFHETPALVLTLARTGSPTSGARGLSFFIVKSDDIKIAGIEKKIGIHCSATCEVIYEDSPGILMGELGLGLIKGAMGMMNTARLAIAAQSLGIAVAAFSEAKKYASEREQFGRLIQEIPAVRRMLERMDREIIAMRCLIAESARCVDMYIWRKKRLKESGASFKDIRGDEQIRFWEKVAGLLTPVSKYYTSEWCNLIAYDAIQIHGGSGYTEDFDVARLFRDARITTIYEGTTQMQIVAAIGGIISGMAPKGILQNYFEKQFSSFTPSEELLNMRKTFAATVEQYKLIKDNEKKEALASEVVESIARVLNIMLIEIALSRVGNNCKLRWQEIWSGYTEDSLIILAANETRIKLALNRKSTIA